MSVIQTITQTYVHVSTGNCESVIMVLITAPVSTYQEDQTAPLAD